MEAKLDEVIGCDFKRIPDVLKRLHAHKESLVNKVWYNDCMHNEIVMAVLLAWQLVRSYSYKLLVLRGQTAFSSFIFATNKSGHARLISSIRNFSAEEQTIQKNLWTKIFSEFTY